MEVVQVVVYQFFVLGVKVKVGFAFTLKRLIYSLLWANVKGEGKNGKFAECAGAYIRVGACPARRVKGILCGVGRFEIKQGKKSRKEGTFGEKVGLYFSSGVGEGEKNNLSCLVVLYLFYAVLLLFDLVLLLFHDVLLLFVLGFLISAPPFSILILLRLWLDEKTPAFLFSTSAKVEIWAIGEEVLPVKLIFSAQNEILGENFSRAEEKNTPKKVDFAPKVAGSGEKGWFWVENHREGMK